MLAGGPGDTQRAGTTHHKKDDNMPKLNSRKGNPKGLNQRIDETIKANDGQLTGRVGEFKYENQNIAPGFAPRGNEYIISNTNSFIVLGTDRPSHSASGYGMYTGESSTIDIVCGRAGTYVDPQGEKQYVDNNIPKDAARIYISELTDIDRNFFLTEGKVGTSDGRSAIGIKADSVRMMSRYGIKLVTKVDGIDSLGNLVGVTRGIDLIAGNKDDDLQPMVKGDDLKDCLNAILDEINELANIISDSFISQSLLNTVLIMHTHPTTIPVTTPSPELGAVAIQKIQQDQLDLTKALQKRVNLVSTRINFLETEGANYILSSFNRTN